MKIIENTMTIRQEAQLILDDLFPEDIQAQNDAINELKERFGVEEPDEIDALILEEEDALYELYCPRAVEEE
jgi:hypothetical protein